MKKRIRSFLFFLSFIAAIVSILQYINSVVPEFNAYTVEIQNQLNAEKTGVPTPSVLGQETTELGDWAVVKKVIDGDTIELENGQTVRYVGIDTPESKKPNTPIQCFSLKAANKNRELVEGKQVRLVKDVSDVDRYKRLLRYVYVGDQLVNEELVREGYAFARSYPPDITQQERLKIAEQVARSENKGLWGSCDVVQNGKKLEWIIK